MLDVKITGGQVFDGTGSNPRTADIGILGGSISAIGRLAGAEAHSTFDARGLSVCPGFVDVHTHSDTFLLVEPSAPSKVLQGVTTEITGNCGASAAPRVGSWRLPADWEDMPYPRQWGSVADFRSLLEQVAPAVNVAMLVGHGNLRGGVVGYGNRVASSSELDAMVRLLEQSMDEGAIGLSSGLVYPPGMFAPRGELETLAGVVERHGGIYTTHMASEGERVVECVMDTLAVGEKTGVRLEISHLKTSGRRNWSKTPAILDLIRRARDAGMKAAADRYPYTYGCTDLDVVFPAWAEEGGRDAVMARLRDPAVREKIRRQLLESRADEDWAEVTVATTRHPENQRFQGLPLPEVAEALGMHAVDAILHLALTDELHTGAFFGSMSEQDMVTILAEHFVMIGSDASARSAEGPLGAGFPHPRAFGTFPRFLRMALDGRTVPVHEAIRKMTSLPAEHFRLAGRGVLRVGYSADILVFDQAAVRDTATPKTPKRYAEGIRHVFVNGSPVVLNGAMTGKRPGRIL
jgi:N-acyl-D-amino-acid deacylase